MPAANNSVYVRMRGTTQWLSSTTLGSCWRMPVPRNLPPRVLMNVTVSEKEGAGGATGRTGSLPQPILIRIIAFFWPRNFCTVSTLEVIHKSEFGVSEQSIFVGIILILVNGHPRGGVSAFFREISAFFLIQNFVKFHAFPTCG